MVVAVNPTYNRESFESAPVVTITSANVADYIYKIYRADVKAIQNLADIAAQLQAGGITCPGTFSISNQLNVSGNTAIGGTLSAGNTTIGGLNAGGTTLASTTINGSLSAGNTTVGSLNAGGTTLASATINGTLSAGATTVGSLSAGTTTISGNLNIDGYLYVKGLKITNNGTQFGMGKMETRGDNDYLCTRWQSPCTDNYNRLEGTTINRGQLFYYSGDGTDTGGNIWKLNPICDRRIKYNIQTANSNELLNKINSLPLQNYNFIDKKYYEGKTVYGLIAQDVKKILPEAVTIIKEYLPNINKIASFYEMNNKIILEVSNNTKIDDNIKLIINEMAFYTKVIDKTYNSITVEKWPNYNESDNVLVYGTMIDDFHTLNQGYLGVLSLGGIQELSKQVSSSNNKILELSKQIKSLHEENKKLTKTVEYLLTK